LQTLFAKPLERYFLLFFANKVMRSLFAKPLEMLLHILWQCTRFVSQPKGEREKEKEKKIPNDLGAFLRLVISMYNKQKKNYIEVDLHQESLVLVRW
jgi:hypothetical protein